MSDISLLLGVACKLISSIPSSVAGGFWFVVQFSWSRYWALIIPIFIGWTIFEKIFGGSSENGFSPVYNIVIGSGVYAFFQFFTYSAFAHFLGDIAYCQIWPLAVHYFIFLITGFLLHISRFWPYWKVPFIGKVRLY